MFLPVSLSFIGSLRFGLPKLETKEVSLNDELF